MDSRYNHSWSWYWLHVAQVDDKYSSLVFGQETVSMKITYYDYQADTAINEFSWPRFTMTIAAGFGELVETLEEPPDGPQRILQGCIIDGVTYGKLTDVDDEDNILPTNVELYQNYPNPFNPTTKIDYYIPKASFVSLIIYDLMGREIKKLIEQEQFSGKHSVIWNGTNEENSKVSSSIYFYKMETAENKIIRKMLLLK